MKYLSKVTVMLDDVGSMTSSCVVFCNQLEQLFYPPNLAVINNLTPGYNRPTMAVFNPGY
jgi:hypothetical protein